MKNFDLFKSLPYSEKKEKLKNILWELKENWNIYDDLYNLITFLDDINENLLDMIYKIILKSIESIESEEIKKTNEKFESIKKLILKIRKEDEINDIEDLEKILSKLT